MELHGRRACWKAKNPTSTESPLGISHWYPCGRQYCDSSPMSQSISEWLAISWKKDWVDSVDVDSWFQEKHRKKTPCLVLLETLGTTSNTKNGGTWLKAHLQHPLLVGKALSGHEGWSALEILHHRWEQMLILPSSRQENHGKPLEFALRDCKCSGLNQTLLL